MEYEGFAIVRVWEEDGFANIELAHADGTRFQLALAPKALVQIAAAQVRKNQEQDLTALPGPKKFDGKSN